MKRELPEQVVFAELNALWHLMPEESEKIRQFFEVINFKEKDIIVQQGKAVKGLYIIQTGKVAVFMRTPGDKPLLLAVFESGEIFGDGAIIAGGLAVSTAQALTAAQCHFLSYEYFNYVRLALPELGEKITNNILLRVCKRLRQINKHIHSVMTDHQSFYQVITKHRKYSKATFKRCRFNETHYDTNYLLSLGVFRALSLDELKILLHYMQLYAVKRDEILFYEGDKADCYYLILQGAVQMSIQRQAKRLKLSVFGPGDIAGDISLIDGKPRTATATVRTDGLIFSLTHENFAQLKIEYPFIWQKLYDFICASLVKVLRKANMELVRMKSQFGVDIQL
ncbi:MAG: Dot/Icm type IV secretion system effector LegN [Gammaproteobacteria bacterium]